MRAGGAGADLEPALTELQEQRRRRKEVERRLSEAGLKRASLDQAPRWLEPRFQARLQGFRQELQARGPLFRLFGRYLGTRLDLLHGSDARDLALLSDDAEPISKGEVFSLLRTEFGTQGAAAVVQLDGDAVESLALSQTHRGVLAGGRRVRVKLARTSAQSDRDLEVLPHLAEYLSSLGWPLPATRRVVVDFANLVARRGDLGGEAETLRRFADLPDEPRLRAPRVVDALSSARVLTIEDPRGAPLFPVQDAPGRTEVKALGETRILTDLWMRRVFDDLQIPEELSRAEVRSTPGGGVEISGGLFHPISSSDAEALWSYLVAAGREDPDEVFHALKRLTAPIDVGRSEGLRHHLGHVVPRRDGRFAEAPPGFPEFLLSHWLQLERHGLVPNPALLAFYRGVVSLRELTGPALSHQVLKEALQVAQISRGHHRLRRTLDPSRMTRRAEGLVKMLIELPRRLERDRRFQHPDHAGPASAKGNELRVDEPVWMGLAVGLLLAATLLLWFLRFPTLLGPWTAPAQALTLAGLGLWLLRSIWNE
jgi:hypothetical protein